MRYMAANSFEYLLDDLVDLLNATKGNLKRALTRNFVEDVDYKITYQTLGQTVGRPKQMIYLTKNCKHQFTIQWALSSRAEICTDENMTEIQYIKRYLPKETEILMFIKRSLESVYPCVTQYGVLGYRLDLYFPNQRLAIECDEHGHKDRDAFRDEERQTRIQNYLDCKFIRFNPDSADFCLSSLMSAILVELSGVKVV